MSYTVEQMRAAFEAGENRENWLLMGSSKEPAPPMFNEWLTQLDAAASQHPERPS